MSLQPISENTKKLNLCPTMTDLLADHGRTAVKKCPTPDIIDLIPTTIKTNTWISINDVANLLDTSERTVRRHCKQGKYDTQMVNENGGKQYRILLESLPQEAIERFYESITTKAHEMGENTLFSQGEAPQPPHAFLNFKQNDETINIIPNEQGLIPTNPAFSFNEVIPESAKSIALARYDLILIWEDFIKKPVGNSVGNKTLEQNAAQICVLVQDDKITSLEIQKLLNVSDQYVYDKIQNGEYRVEETKSRGRGGKKYLIFVNSLPIEAQLAYYYDNTQQYTYKNELAKGGKTELTKQFIALYNAKYWNNIYTKLGNVSIQTLYRWKKSVKDNNDWRELLPAYNYQSSKVLSTSLSKIEQETLLDVILKPNKFDIATARKWVKIILQKRGYDQFASYPAYKRYVDHYKKFNSDIWVLSREGEKALKDKILPYIRRDASMLKVGDLVVADGHVLDFQVINPFTGKPCRPVLVGFQDWASDALVGYDIMITENTQCVCSALRNAILTLGRIPKFVLLDNGKSFKNKFFKGVDDFEEVGFRGVYANLGITTVFAQPYNARAKKIERFFNTFTNSFEKVVPSYIGNTIENKPAWMMRNEKWHRAEHQKNEFIPSIDQAISMINWWIENYYNQQLCTLETSKTIQQVLDDGKGSGVDINKLDDLLMSQEIKSVRRCTIKFLGFEYSNEKLYGLNDRVIIRYSLFDLSSIQVYTLRNEYICTAKTVQKCHILANYLGDSFDVENLKHALKEQNQLKKQTIERLTGKKRKPKKKQAENKLDWSSTALIGADLKPIIKEKRNDNKENKKTVLWKCDKEQD